MRPTYNVKPLISPVVPTTGNAQDGQWELIDRLSDIRKEYFICADPFKRSFIWDVLCCFPFIQVSCAIWKRSLEELAQGSGSYASWKLGWEIVHWLSLFRVLKLYRLWKLAETAENIQRASMSQANLLTLAKMIFYLFFVAHYLGCIWFAVGNVTPGSDTFMADFESSWTYLEGSIWIENGDGTFTRKIEADPDGWLYEWLTSIYWAVTTMTTIGLSPLDACSMSYVEGDSVLGGLGKNDITTCFFSREQGMEIYLHTTMRRGSFACLPWHLAPHTLPGLPVP